MNKIINEKQRKKRRILHASIKLFTKKGFQETTIENITWKARVEKGTFLQLF
jgi:AcrR family transcriptional regulator